MPCCPCRRSAGVPMLEIAVSGTVPYPLWRRSWYWRAEVAPRSGNRSQRRPLCWNAACLDLAEDPAAGPLLRARRLLHRSAAASGPCRDHPRALRSRAPGPSGGARQRGHAGADARPVGRGQGRRRHSRRWVGARRCASAMCSCGCSRPGTCWAAPRWRWSTRAREWWSVATTSAPPIRPAPSSCRCAATCSSPRRPSRCRCSDIHRPSRRSAGCWPVWPCSPSGPTSSAATPSASASG